MARCFFLLSFFILYDSILVFFRGYEACETQLSYNSNRKKNSEISKCRSKIKNVPLYTKLTKSIFQIIKQKCLDFNKCITTNKFEAMYADYNKIIIGNFNDFLKYKNRTYTPKIICGPRNIAHREIKL